MMSTEARKMLATSIADLLAGFGSWMEPDRGTRDDWRDEAEAIARCFTPYASTPSGQPVFRFHGPANNGLWDSEQRADR